MRTKHEPLQRLLQQRQLRPPDSGSLHCLHMQYSTGYRRCVAGHFGVTLWDCNTARPTSHVRSQAEQSGDSKTKQDENRCLSKKLLQ